MLSVRDLTCVRGEYRVFAGVSVDLPEGTCLNVKGANGSGKTSLLRLLAGLSRPESGTIRWGGEPIEDLAEDYHRALLYLGHSPAVKDDLSAAENLRFAAWLTGENPSSEACAEALRTIGLGSRADLPAKVLSQGQRRRIGLARLLLSRKPLWILDEPYTALDVAAVESVRGILERHLDGGGLLVLTTHQDVPLRTGRSHTLALDP
jgi:heme exporter protein A